MLRKVIFIAALCSSFSLFADGKPIVEFQGVTFTDEELLAAVADQSPQYQEALSRDSNTLNNFLKRLFVSRLVAEKNKAALLKDKNVAIALQLNEERNIHEMLIKKKYLEKIKDIDFKKLAKTEYAANAEKYKSAFSIDFHHILFLKHNNLSDVDPKAKAEQVLTDIRAKKTSMADAAKQYQMPMAGVDKDGLVKGATTNSLMPKITEALQAQKVGDVSEVIETNSGFHIVSLSKVNKPESIEFHEPLQAKIIGTLEKNLQNNVTSSISLPYNDIDTYTIHEDALKAVFDKILQGKK